MEEKHEVTYEEIMQSYTDQWVVVEETSWNAEGMPVRGVVRACGQKREELRVSLQTLHQRLDVKTFVFYTGDKIPEHLSVVL